jgi:hypothetical protein
MVDVRQRVFKRCLQQGVVLLLRVVVAIGLRTDLMEELHGPLRACVFPRPATRTFTTSIGVLQLAMYSSWNGQSCSVRAIA